METCLAKGHCCRVQETVAGNYVEVPRLSSPDSLRMTQLVGSGHSANKTADRVRLTKSLEPERQDLSYSDAQYALLA
jgi:hypothetical protein